MFKSLTELELADDVLQIAVEGVLDLPTMQSVIDMATQGHTKAGPKFGALLLDLTQTTALRLTVGGLADLWLERMPQRPCAVLRHEGGEAAWYTLALRLANAPPGQAVVLNAFGGNERQAAEAWCRSIAVTYRFELARRLRT